MPSEHLTDGESASLFFAGLLTPALIFGGLAGIAAGLYFDTAIDFLIAEVVFGAAAFGAGCGLLGVLVGEGYGVVWRERMPPVLMISWET
jgi:hypothetical protein